MSIRAITYPRVKGTGNWAVIECSRMCVSDTWCERKPLDLVSGLETDQVYVPVPVSADTEAAVLIARSYLRAASSLCDLCLHSASFPDAMCEIRDQLICWMTSHVINGF